MNNSEKNLSPNNEPENPGRRGFIRGILGGAMVTALGVKGVNKYIEKEKEINDLHAYFEGKENDFYIVNEAANMLIQEMRVANIQRVKLSGTGSSNERIDVLRDYLTRHLNSPAGYKYSFKQELFSFGYYTKESLTDILNTTITIINSKKSESNQSVFPPKKHSDKLSS